MNTELFGKKGKDIITGFTGTITGKCEYISGCSQLLLSPDVDENGNYREPQWIDESRIEINDESGIIQLPDNKVLQNPGPDKAAPKR